MMDEFEGLVCSLGHKTKGLAQSNKPLSHAKPLAQSNNASQTQNHQETILCRAFHINSSLSSSLQPLCPFIYALNLFPFPKLQPQSTPFQPSCTLHTLISHSFHIALTCIHMHFKNQNNIVPCLPLPFSAITLHHYTTIHTPLIHMQPHIHSLNH